MVSRALASALNDLPNRGFLAGCTMSTAGSSTTMSVSAGVAMSDDVTTLMSLAAISKTTGAWVAGSGNGGLDTGSIAASTWYHFFVIENPTAQLVDVLLSLSPTTPTLPTGYTKQRRIGSGLTNGSSQWRAFSQNGDEFLWVVPSQDINTSSLGTTSTPFTLLVPTGVVVNALISGWAKSTTSGCIVTISSPALGTLAADATYTATVPGSNAFGGFGASIRTNTSAVINGVADNSSTNFVSFTNGWIDTRGRYN